MKRTRTIEAAVLLFTTSAVALWPIGEARPEDSPTADLAQAPPVNQEDRNRALANCRAAIEQVHTITIRMSRAGTFWSRGRANYSEQDLSSLSHRANELRASLNVMTQGRRVLASIFSDGSHDMREEEHLRGLDRIEVTLYSASSQLSHDLSKAKPGPGSPEIKWDIDAAKKAARQWRAELQQLSKDESLSSRTSH